MNERIWTSFKQVVSKLGEPGATDILVARWICEHKQCISSLNPQDLNRFVFLASRHLLAGFLTYSCDALATLIQELMYSGAIATPLPLISLVNELCEIAAVGAITHFEHHAHDAQSLKPSLLAITMPKSAGTFIANALMKRGIANYDGHLIGNAANNFMSLSRLNVMSATGQSVTHSHVEPTLYNRQAVAVSQVPKVWIHVRSDIYGALRSLIRMVQLEPELFISGDGAALRQGVNARRILDNDPAVTRYVRYFQKFDSFWREFADHPPLGKEILATSYADFNADPLGTLANICNFYGVSEYSSNEYEDLSQLSGVRNNANATTPILIEDLFTEDFLSCLRIC